MLKTTAGTEVPDDSSLPVLRDLYNQGYDRFSWILTERACHRCNYVANKINAIPGGAKLVDLIEGNIIKDAPIYTLAHVNCACKLKVFKSKEPENYVIVSAHG